MLAIAYTVAALCILVALAWSWIAGSRQTAPGSNVPLCPGSKPILGHFLGFLATSDRMYDYMTESVRAMGYRTCAFLIPLQPPLIMIMSAQNVEYVLKTNFNNYEKGEFFFSRFHQLLGHGIFTQDGADWYWQRKLASHIFSVEGFKKYVNVVFGDKLAKLISRLASSASSGETLDLQDLMYAFTLDAFAQLGFGTDPGALKSREKLPFAKDFDDAQAIINDRFWIPAWPLVERLNGTAARMTQDMNVIKGFAVDIINKRRSQLAAAAAAHQSQAPAGSTDSDSNSSSAGSTGSAQGGFPGRMQAADAVVEKDLLLLFMEATGPDGTPLTDQQLIDTVLNFMLAGRDTTAQALSWTMYELMKHPEKEQQLLAELEEVLAETGTSTTSNAAAATVTGVTATAEPLALAGSSDNNSNTAAAAAAAGAGGQPTYDQIRQLRYAKACFLEALRLHPVVPSDVKFAVEADKLPDGSIVPKGAQVAYPIVVINKMPSFWGPDAESYRPERWLEMSSAPSPYSFPTFNAGPRLCLGQRLAELEGVYVLAGMLRRFRFELAGCNQVTYAPSTTLPICGGLPVVVKAR